MRVPSISLLLVLSSVCMCAVAEPVEYATVVAEPTVRARPVNFADLNLQRHEGAVTLYRRIRHAADLVCYESEMRSMKSQLNARRCRSDAIGRAVAQVGVPALTTLHAQNVKAATLPMVARESR